MRSLGGLARLWAAPLAVALVTAGLAAGVSSGRSALLPGGRAGGNARPAPAPPPAALPAEPSARLHRPPRAGGTAAPPPAAALYREILHTAIAPQQVYRVDGLNIDDEDVQITLEHGLLGLLQPIAGQTTGAVFAGQGEIFVLPPNAAERLSMTNYTGLAFLNETFNSAYFRYSDGALQLSTASLAQLLPASPDGQQFAARWDPTVAALNREQALRLLAGFLNHDRTPYFFARIGGEQLGAFDVLVDRSRPEQVEIAAPGFAAGNGGQGGRAYANVWASFPMRSARLAGGRDGGYAGPDLRVLHYQVATHIAPDLELSGQATVRFRARLSGDRVIMFHLDPRLRLASVTGARGEPLLYVQNGLLRGPGIAPAGGAAGGRTDRIAVILRAPLRAGQSYALRFQYAGRIITETAGGLFGLTNRMDWYPNRALQPATHDLSFVYPRGLTLVATGRKTAAADAAPAGYQAARWIASRPSDMAGFNLGHFQMAQAMARRGARVGDAAQRAGGPSPQGPTPIQVYAAPHSTNLAHLVAIAQQSAWTVEFYQQRFGPFPYPRLALTELPFPLGQGWPGLIYLAQDAFLTPAEMENHHLPPQAQALYPLMRPHEIAHQWWGNEVAWKSYHDQWLSEALASYAALLDVNAQFRPGALRQVLAYDRTQVLRRNAGGRAVDAAGPLSLGMRLDSARFPHAYATLVYDKGPWVIHMLREMMRLEPPDGPLPAPGPPLAAPAAGRAGGAQGGAAAGPPPPPDAADARFFGFLRAFAQQYAGRAASTLDFERLADRFMPPGLKAAGPRGGWHWFFQEWVDGTGIPAYAVDHLQRQGRMLQGILQQSDVPLGFTMPVPLYLAAAVGCADHCRPVYLGSVLSQGPSTEFELKLPRGWAGTAVPEVLIDPYHTILRR